MIDDDLPPSTITAMRNVDDEAPWAMTSMLSQNEGSKTRCIDYGDG